MTQFQAGLKKKFIDAIDKYSPQIEAFLDQSKSGFFGSSVSWVDFYVTDSIFTMKNYEPEVVGKYKKLLAHQEKVFGLPKLKDYIDSRKFTQV